MAVVGHEDEWGYRLIRIRNEEEILGRRHASQIWTFSQGWDPVSYAPRVGDPVLAAENPADVDNMIQSIRASLVLARTVWRNVSFGVRFYYINTETGLPEIGIGEAKGMFGVDEVPEGGAMADAIEARIREAINPDNFGISANGSDTEDMFNRLIVTMYDIRIAAREWDRWMGGKGDNLELMKDGFLTINKKDSHYANEYMRIQDVKSLYNNCLISAILKQLEIVKVDPYKIRVMAGFPDGVELCVTDIPKIVEILGDSHHFNVNWKVIHSVPIIDRKIEETQPDHYLKVERFTAQVKVDFPPIATGSFNKNYGITRDITIVYHQSIKHFTSFVKFLPLNYDKNCGVILRSNQSLSYEDRKKSLIQQGKLHESEKTTHKTREVPYDHYLGFDFETILRFPEGISCYSASLSLQSLKEEKDGSYAGQIKESEEILHCDLPSPPESNTEADMLVLDKMFASLGEWIRKHSMKNVCAIAYNGGSFDFFILFNYMSQRGFDITDVRMGGTRFLSLTFVYEGCRFVCWDLYRIVMCGLAKACKDFKTPTQKRGDYNHSEFQREYEQGGFKQLDEFCRKNRTKIIDYNWADTQGMMELFFKVRTTVDRMFKSIRTTKKGVKRTRKPVEFFQTIAQLTKSMWFKGYKERLRGHMKGVKGREQRKAVMDAFLPLPAKTRATWEFFRKAIIGGRCQVFDTTETTDCLESIDVVSLYPFAMASFSYPVGREIETNTYQPGKLGIYECDIHFQNEEQHNVIPLKATPHNWTYKGAQENIVLCSVDIEQVIKYSGPESITVKRGYYWERSDPNMYKHYIEPIIAEKMLQDVYKNSEDPEVHALFNAAMRAMCKLVPNALSGKMAQKEYETALEFMSCASSVTHDFTQYSSATFYSTDAEHGFGFLRAKKDVRQREKDYEKHPGSFVQLACFIYAYSRRHMMDTVISKLKTIKAMDTDSALGITRVEFETHKAKYPELFGNKLGQFTCEMREFYEDAKIPYSFETKQTFIALQPKVYLILDADTQRIVKKRWKGIGPDDRVITKDSAPELREWIGDVPEANSRLGKRIKRDHNCLERYQNLPKALTADLYKRVQRGETVYVVSSRMCKEIVSNTTMQLCTISGKYIVKSISL